MVDWQGASLLTFVVLIIMNCGLIAIDQSNTEGLSIFGAESGGTVSGFDANWTGGVLQSKILGTVPTDDSGNPCPSWMPCKTYTGVEALADNIIGGISTIVAILLFAFWYLFLVLFGFPSVMTYLAATIAPGNDAIATLFTVVWIVPTAFAYLGLFKYFYDLMQMRRL